MAIDSRTLAVELRPVLAELRDDLLERAKDEGVRAALEAAYRRQRTARRTDEPFELWCRGRCTQVAAAWVLSVVFVRTLEDRGLIERRRIAGPGAEDSEEHLLSIAPFLSARDYLLTVFKELSHLPGAEAVFDARHNPVWALGPSGPAARKLIDLFRRRDEAGELRYRFEGTDTRFLGDLYQDLDEEIRKRYALLQTPDFIESFILDETLDPAIEAFGLAAVKLIDPTCGSGHFLLGAFRRLFERWQEAEPATDRRVLAQRALAQVHGVDLNPYAVAIARFRLTLAFLDAAGMRRVTEAPPLPLNLAVADSLLHGVSGQELLSRGLGVEDKAVFGHELFTLEDEAEALRILGQRFHAVVGNPPYITVKDEALRELYRGLYKRSAAGKYALVAPFTERFFDLAVDRGFVGAIVGNAFMKREFGKKLIEDVLRQLDLTHVVDTSGAFIPGHGTPTAILFGRRQRTSGAPVLAVLGKRGEPTTPEEPENGLVWSSIRDHHREVGFENDYVSVSEVERERFDKHPWSLGGGGAGELKALLEERAEERLGDIAQSIGITAFTLEDDAFLADETSLKRRRVETELQRPMVIGEAIRDWSASETPQAVFPYDGNFKPIENEHCRAIKYLWPCRTNLANNFLFGGKTKRDAGMRWYEYGRLTSDKLRTPLSIAFAFVATHNHFVLDRGGKVFNRSAPIIKLPEGATEDDHLALLGYVNSSTVCFWMKQVCQPKHMGNASGANATPFLVRFEFDGTKLGAIPLPRRILEGKQRERVAHLARDIDWLATQLRNSSPASWLDFGFMKADELMRIAEVKMLERENLRNRALWKQELIDWTVYSAFEMVDDFISEDLLDSEFELRRGHRPFELRLSKISPELSAEWSSWHLCEDVAELPVDYPAAVRDFVRAAFDAIDASDYLRSLEAPEYKRRWLQPQGKAAQEPVTDETLFREALPRWLVEQIERKFIELTADGANALTTRHVSLALVGDPKVQAVAEVLTGESSPDLEKLFADLIGSDAVPYTSALRYTETGLEKRAAWERTWELQRREDVGEKLDVPAPPKYGQPDFRDQVYWRHRGKLDVPKERFISYPGCESDEDASPIVGWAGWDHLQQATALAALYRRRKDEDGWEAERLTPILAGLAELVPWVKQWHNDPDPRYGGTRPGDALDALVREECLGLGLTLEKLKEWRPAKRTRGGRAKTSGTKAGGNGSRAAKSGPSPDDVLDAVRALAASENSVEQREIAERLGVAPTAVSKVADKLVEEGKLTLVSARPKRFKVVV